MEAGYNEFFYLAMKALGAGIAMFGAIGAGIGVGVAASGGLQAMGRNPDAAPVINATFSFSLSGICYYL